MTLALKDLAYASADFGEGIGSWDDSHKGGPQKGKMVHLEKCRRDSDKGKGDYHSKAHPE